MKEADFVRNLERNLKSEDNSNSGSSDSGSKDKEKCSEFPFNTADEERSVDEMYIPYDLSSYSFSYRTCKSKLMVTFGNSADDAYNEGDDDAAQDNDGNENDNNDDGDGDGENDENNRRLRDDPSNTFTRLNSVYFMMCPTSTCSSFDGSNCGIYIMNLDAYMSIFTSYWQEKTSSFCENCSRLDCSSKKNKNFCEVCSKRCQDGEVLEVSDMY